MKTLNEKLDKYLEAMIDIKIAHLNTKSVPQSVYDNFIRRRTDFEEAVHKFVDSKLL